MPKERKYYNVVNEEGEDVTIHLYGAVGWDNTWWGDGTNNEAHPFVQLLKRLDKKAKRIHLHINSPGGIISEGLAIYNTLRNCNAEIHTYNNGIVASMATIIFLAGDVRHCPKTALSHFHRAISWVWGNITDMENEIAALEVFETTLIAAIMRVAQDITEEQVRENWFTGEDYFLTAEQMQQYGFVTDITKDKVKAPVSAPQNHKEVVAAFDEIELSRETPKNQGLFSRAASIIGNAFAPPKPETTEENTPKINNKMPNMLKIQNVAFAAFMESFHFEMTDGGGVVLDEKQFNAIQQEFTAGRQAKKDLEAITAERDALQTKVNDLEAKVKKTPKPNAQAGDAGDSSVPGTETENFYPDPVNAEVQDL